MSIVVQGVYYHISRLSSKFQANHMTPSVSLGRLFVRYDRLRSSKKKLLMYFDAGAFNGPGYVIISA